MPWEVEHIGPHTLYRGDCRKVLPTLPRVDVCLTDPPCSAVTHTGARGGDCGQNHLIAFACMSTAASVTLAADLCAQTRRWVVMTVDWRHAAAIEAAQPALFVRAGIWVKPNGAPQFTGDRPGTGWESVVILHRPGKKHWNGGGHHAVWQIPKIEGQHPTEKPLPLLRTWLQQFSQPQETVLDPFMGSGTTGVACVQLGRIFMGVEIERQYFDIACQRLHDALAQPDMFVPTPAPVQQRLFAGGT